MTSTAVVRVRLDDVAHLARQPLAHVDVEVGERLVEEQELGLRRERAGERDALLLAAGQLVRILVRVADQTHCFHQLRDAPRALGPRGAACSPKPMFSATGRWGKSA